jgi:hypothetical protein
MLEVALIGEVDFEEDILLPNSLAKMV